MNMSKNNNKNPKFNYFDMNPDIIGLVKSESLNLHLISNLLEGIKPSKIESKYQDLKEGYELRPIEELNDKGEPLENKLGYSYLYHNGLKISDEVFRKGGIGTNGFVDGYCTLLRYGNRIQDKSKKTLKFEGIGDHVIVNRLGDVCLDPGGLETIYHLGGNLASVNGGIYDLRKGERIFENIYSTMKGNSCVVIENRYNWKNQDFPKGIYRIDYETAEITLIDEIK